MSPLFQGREEARIFRHALLSLHRRSRLDEADTRCLHVSQPPTPETHLRGAHPPQSHCQGHVSPAYSCHTQPSMITKSMFIFPRQQPIEMLEG